MRCSTVDASMAEGGSTMMCASGDGAVKTDVML